MKGSTFVTAVVAISLAASASQARAQGQGQATESPVRCCRCSVQAQGPVRGQAQWLWSRCQLWL